MELPIEVVVSSTMNRAKETSEIIIKRISKPVEYSDLFAERRRSSEVLGKPKNALIALKVEQEINHNFYKSGFRFSDEENFDDLKSRALTALNYLAKRSEENILVVTHGFFMRVILACVVFGAKLSGEECQQFIRAFHMENTGITVLGYDEKETDSQWWLWTWNDHAHLE